MSTGEMIALAGFLFAVMNAGIAYVAARAGSSAAVTLHLAYLRRDVDKAARMIDGAHWRLDKIKAPPAPLEV